MGSYKEQKMTRSSRGGSGYKKVLIGVLVTVLLVCAGIGIIVWQTRFPDTLPPPYFRLRDLYDEPYERGWGIDLPGYGPTLRFTGVQAHTLKPGSVPHEDGHLALQGGRIVFSGAGEGRCVEAVQAEDEGGLDAALCSDDSSLQRWEAVEDGLLRLVNTELCITVGGNYTEGPAGPWARRDLLIRQCVGGRDQI